MDKDDIQKDYIKNQKDYLKLAENLKHALETFLIDNEISYHTISFRVKEFESYHEKIERKGYDNPKEQIEDFCGLRIVCFYPNDLSKISEVIAKEFDVLESIDKTENIEPDRFGYRSHHYIVKIKKDWAKAPNYRNLEHLKAEIQVRTILMHTWADIEHKLAYKKKEEIPLAFRRKLYQLSALLEIADGQFQELKIEKANFQKSLISKNRGVYNFDFSEELNLDTLQSYLDFTFPERKRNEKITRTLLDELITHKINLKELDAMRQQVSEIIGEVEEDITTPGKWAQVGIVRAILDLKSDAYWNARSEDWGKNSWGKAIRKWRSKIDKK